MYFEDIMAWYFEVWIYNDFGVNAEGYLILKEAGSLCYCREYEQY